MIRTLALMLLVFSSHCHAALADTIRLKDGEFKEGKVVEENSQAILFNSEKDGAVIEIKKSDISLLDRTLVEKGDSGEAAVRRFTGYSDLTPPALPIPKKETAQWATKAKELFMKLISRSSDAKKTLASAGKS